MKFKDLIDKYKWDDVYSTFIGHCLWEMTFYGFTQEKIKKQLVQLEKEAEEAKKNPSSLRKLVKSENGEKFFWEDKDGNRVPFLEFNNKKF